MGKEYEYFVLTRETEHGKEVTGDYLTSVSEGASEGQTGRQLHVQQRGGAAASTT